MYNNKRFITFIIISAPIILLGILQILPTFDDWTTLSAPNRDPNFLQYFLPYGMTWRPGDALIGYVNGFLIVRISINVMANAAQLNP